MKSFVYGQPASHFVTETGLESSGLFHLGGDCLRDSGKHAIPHELPQARERHKEVIEKQNKTQSHLGMSKQFDSPNPR